VTHWEDRPHLVCIDVALRDGTSAHYAVPTNEGWRVDPRWRLLVIGHGVPRVMIPLDNVQHFEIVGADD
jgi:hypothetical protein